MQRENDKKKKLNERIVNVCQKVICNCWGTIRQSIAVDTRYHGKSIACSANVTVFRVQSTKVAVTSVYIRALAPTMSYLINCEQT